jgi:hypothetical protein
MNSKRKSSSLTALIILSLFILPLIASGCQSEPQTNQVNSHQQAKQIETESAREEAPQETTHDSENSNLERKIIKQSQLRLVSNDLSSLPEKITNIMDTHDGYISSSRQGENYNQQKFLDYTLRIPADQFNTVLTELEKLGRVTEKRTNARDITEEYIDLQARLNNFKAQEERYLKLLDEAEDVEDVLAVEKELNRVRQEIESLQGRLDYYDNKVSMSTINLHISQPERAVSPGWNLGNSFKQAVKAFLNSINLIIILIGRLLPWLLLLSITGYLLYKGAKKILD